MSTIQIPRILLQTSKEKPAPYVVDLLRQYSSDWTYQHYVDSEILQFFADNPLAEFPEVARVFHSFRNGEHKADLFRYYFLYVKGGVYVDSDAMIYAELDGIVKSYDFVSVDGRNTFPNTIFQGFLAATPGHPIIYAALKDAYATNPATLVHNYSHFCITFYTLYQATVSAMPELKTKLYYECMNKEYTLANVYNDEGQAILSHYWNTNTVPPVQKPRIRLHMPAIPHTLTRDEFSHCAFTGKVQRFATMMRRRGFEVYHYGVESSTPDADKDIQLLTLNEWNALRVQSYKTLYPTLTDDMIVSKMMDKATFFGDLANFSTPLYHEFNRRFRTELMKRYRGSSTDIVCLPVGEAYDMALVGLPYLIVETGIGYNNPNKDFRIYESYAWLNNSLGKENKWPSNYWYVIPMNFNLLEFPLSLNPDKTTVGFLGRIGNCKGCNIVVEIARKFPSITFVLCGQGDPSPYLVLPNIKYNAPIHGAERGVYLGSVVATLIPTTFAEPFCAVAVESQLCGTPVVCADSGGMVETVKQFKTGVRCHTLADYCLGIQMAVDGKFDRVAIRDRAVRKYSMDTVAKRYEYVLRSMLDVFNGKNGWYSPDSHLVCLREPTISAIYYINLTRRIDRDTHFLRQCAKHAVPMELVKRVEAVDGTTYQFTDAEKAMFARCDFLGKPFEAKIMGNQLSHYKILQEIVATGKEYSLVFQDDVVLKDGFMDELAVCMRTIPADAELVHIGFHAAANYSHFVACDLSGGGYTAHRKHRVSDTYCVLSDAALPCSLAYIVTLRGAKALLHYFQTTGFLRATDFNYIDYLKGRGLYYGTNTVLCTGNPELGSDIF